MNSFEVRDLIPDGLTENENELSKSFISMIDRIFDTWAETGADLEYHYDDSESSRPMTFDTLSEKDQYFQSRIDAYVQRAEQHYLTRPDAYHEQAIIEATLAGHLIDFEGDTANDVRVILD